MPKSNTDLFQKLLEHVYDLESRGQGRIAARDLALTIEKLFSYNLLETIDFIPFKVEVSRLSFWILCVLVRATSRAKDMLVNWAPLYEAAWNEVEKGDPGRAKPIFIGLPVPVNRTEKESP